MKIRHPMTLRHPVIFTLSNFMRMYFILLYSILIFLTLLDFIPFYVIEYFELRLSQFVARA